MNSTIENAIRKHLKYISGEIGIRPAGSDTDHKLTDYVAAAFARYDLQVEEQSFPCPRWQWQQAELHIGGLKLQPRANTYSPPADFEAAFIPLGTLDELQQADLSGKIALLYGDLTAEQLFPRQFKYVTIEKHNTIINLLEAGQPAAIITVTTDLARLLPIIEDWDFSIPSMTVNAHDGLKLMQNQEKEILFRLESTRTESLSANIRGLTTPAQARRILIFAHSDSYHGSPGLLDNGSGVAALLALAERLSKSNLPIGIEFLTINGHDSNGLGADAYFESSSDPYTGLAAVINMDSIGHILAPNAVSLFNFEDSLQEHIHSEIKRYSDLLPGEPWFYGEHVVFVQQGIPVMAVYPQGFPNLTHTAQDTLEWLDVERISRVVSFVESVIKHLAHTL